MLDNTKVKSGFDVELLLGGRYFLTLLKSALTTGNFPQTVIPFVGAELIIDFESAIQCDLNNEGINTALIDPAYGTTMTYHLAGRLTFKRNENPESPNIYPCRFIIGSNLAVNNGVIELLQFVLHSKTQKDIDAIGKLEGIPLLGNLVWAVFDSMPNKSMGQSPMISNVRRFELQRLNSTDTCQTAIGLYFNLDLDLEGLYENRLAEYMHRHFWLVDCTQWATGDEVLKYIDTYNNPVDVRGEPAPKPTPQLYPQMEMDADYYAACWHPRQLAILPENWPNDIVGADLELPEGTGIQVRNLDGNTMPPQVVAEAGGGSIFAHCLGPDFGGVEVNAALGWYVVKNTQNEEVPHTDLLERFRRNPPRGDIRKAVNYLPVNVDFIIGVNPHSVQRFGRDRWNRMLPENRSKMPPYYEKGKKAGKYNSQRISLADGAIRIKTNLTYYVTGPDAEVNISSKITPVIGEDHSLRWDMKIEDVDVDTDWDIILGFGLGILGCFAFFGGAFLGIGVVAGGASLGAGTGAIVDEVASSAVKKEASEVLQTQKADLFSLLPPVIGFFPRYPENEICYYEMHGAAHLYHKAVLNESGMVVGGQVEPGMYCVPLDVDIVDRRREVLPESGEEKLAFLTYENASGVRQELPVSSLVPRMEESKLKKVNLVPERIHRGPRRIESISFTTGLNLRIDELLSLLRKGIISIEGYVIVRTSKGTSYLRNVADNTVDNNLSDMSSFRPES